MGRGFESLSQSKNYQTTKQITMAKRLTSIGRSQHANSHKTAKRLAIKKEMLEAKAAKQVGKNQPKKKRSK